MLHLYLGVRELYLCPPQDNTGSISFSNRRIRQRHARSLTCRALVLSLTAHAGGDVDQLGVIPTDAVSTMRGVIALGRQKSRNISELMSWRNYTRKCVPCYYKTPQNSLSYVLLPVHANYLVDAYQNKVKNCAKDFQIKLFYLLESQSIMRCVGVLGLE